MLYQRKVHSKNFNGCFVVSWEDIKPSEVWQDKLVKKIYEVSFLKKDPITNSNACYLRMSRNLM